MARHLSIRDCRCCSLLLRNDHQPETGQGILRAVFGLMATLNVLRTFCLRLLATRALSLEGVVAVQVVLDGKDCDDHDSIRW